jgi:hypothetical protein
MYTLGMFVASQQDAHARTMQMQGYIPTEGCLLPMEHRKISSQFSQHPAVFNFVVAGRPPYTP